jgi:tetratricopeptide (TPR) repeat protein
METVKKHQSAWNPKGIALFSLLFTFVPAAILFTINYGKLGYPEKRKAAIITVVIPLIVLLLIRMYFVEVGLSPFLIFDLLVAFYFYKTQNELFKTFIAKGGKKESLLKPIIYSILIIATIIATLYGISWWQFKNYENQLKEANYYLDHGKYTQAERLYKDLIRRDSNQTAVYNNLANLYEKQKNYKLAKESLEQLLKIDPNDRQAKEFLQEIELEESSR